MPGPTPAAEAELVRRLLSGDEAAWVELYRSRQGPLYRFALRMSGSAAIAEDVVQEVFLSMVRGIGRWRPERGSLSAYLFGAARHLVLRRIERERPYVALDGGAEERADPAQDPARAHDVAQVRRAVLALPPHQREVIVLCELERFSYEEAAQALECPIGTIRSRLHRAREALAAALRPAAERTEARADQGVAS
jgi:RNA polymerase sigma-70 factor (ECF subfamily)